MKVTPRIDAHALSSFKASRHVTDYQTQILTNGFTIGRAYEVIAREGIGYTVRNDNGHERFVSLNGHSAHIVVRAERDRYGMDQKSIGYFEESKS